MTTSKTTKTIFQLVHKVLSELYEQVKVIHGAAADDKIKAAMEALSKSYGNLTDDKMPPIDYADPTTRLAYVYSYVASHADFVRQILDLTSDVLADELFQQEKLVVSCLGGGPGSELVGMLQHLVSCSTAKVGVLTTYLCDREQAWADSWTEIGQELEANIKLYLAFQKLDVTVPSDWQKQRKFLGADLFIASYFASELWRFQAQAKQFWEEVGANAKKGAKVLFIDNNDSRFIAYVEAIAKENGFEPLARKTMRLTPSFDERTTDLGDFPAKFGRSPKLVGNLFYCVYVKK